MININLLPEEYRRRARTPIKITLATIGVIGANAMLLTWFSWLALGVKAEIDSEHQVLQTELDGLTPQVTFHKALETERKSFAAREETLSSITGNRINWTRKVDELVTVINSGGGGERHYVWLDDLTVSQTADPRAQSAGSVKASGHSGSAKFDQIANFLEDIERSPFIEEFAAPAPPAGTQSKEDKELIPAVVWSFPLQLDLKTLEQRKADKLKSAPQSPSGPEQGESGAQKTEGAATSEVPSSKSASPESKSASPESKSASPESKGASPESKSPEGAPVPPADEVKEGI